MINEGASLRQANTTSRSPAEIVLQDDLDWILALQALLNGGRTTAAKEIQDAGRKEDDPGTRCLNHFHDPITGNGLTMGESAQRWAQDSYNQQKGLIYRQWPFTDHADYSWRAALRYYYLGLGSGERSRADKAWSSKGTTGSM